MFAGSGGTDSEEAPSSKATATCRNGSQSYWFTARLAALIGKEPLTRMNYLLEIASLHTRAELLAQPGLGRTGVRRIETWMAFHGHRMRDANESLDSVICQFAFRHSSARKKPRRSLSLHQKFAAIAARRLEARSRAASIDCRGPAVGPIATKRTSLMPMKRRTSRR